MLNLRKSNRKKCRIKSRHDNKLVGLGVADALVRDIADPETGEVYPALSCYNNPEWAARCTTPGAEKALWVINANERFNSDCAVMLRDGFRTGKVRLLISEYDGESCLAQVKGYGQLTTAERLSLQLPYINTTLLINELINLQHDDSSGSIKISTRSGMRKDRYSSLSYNYYVACQLEKELTKRRNTITKDQEVFMFRAPKVK